MLRSRCARLALAALSSIGVVAACATSVEDPIRNTPDSGEDDSGPGADSRPPFEASTTCTLGSVDHCGSCEISCAGPEPVGTTRYCRDATVTATCELLCHGEYYDVDGKLENGCEMKDEPLQDSVATAVAITLPNVPNDATFKSNPLNVVAAIGHDDRKHDDDSGPRPYGREDWFKVTSVGPGSPSATMTACLSAVNFPTDNELEVCISANGATTFVAAGCKTLVVTPDGGGGSQCVSPAGNPDVGTFMVRVRKTKGSPTANGYALFLNH